ncbi:hypothetical protein OVY01_22480 [Robbsia sp. Bb-Pol-6]|uniref:Uncharacterized protein n=1 Tax=Robbsia betulipollinis TaxID=2981849 RepID=A0ABT3ZTK2_9BURK|nr:hypothetical protein [Robbsia betulipollinis]MCY0389909.1 hypothetical protein [Robbsia betulipollinis]
MTITNAYEAFDVVPWDHPTMRSVRLLNEKHEDRQRTRQALREHSEKRRLVVARKLEGEARHWY